MILNRQRRNSSFNFKTYLQNPILAHLLNQRFYQELPFFQFKHHQFSYQKGGTSQTYTLSDLLALIQTQDFGLTPYVKELLNHALDIERCLLPFGRLYESTSFRDGKLYLFQTCQENPQCFHQLEFPLFSSNPSMIAHYTYQERLTQFGSRPLREEVWETTCQGMLVRQWKELLLVNHVRTYSHLIYEQLRFDLTLLNFPGTNVQGFERLSDHYWRYNFSLNTFNTSFSPSFIYQIQQYLLTLDGIQATDSEGQVLTLDFSSNLKNTPHEDGLKWIQQELLGKIKMISYAKLIADSCKS